MVNLQPLSITYPLLKVITIFFVSVELVDSLFILALDRYMVAFPLEMDAELNMEASPQVTFATLTS